MTNTALKFNKINSLDGYETLPGPAIPVFIENDLGTAGDGAEFTNLDQIPTSAGIIPNANLPTTEENVQTGTTYTLQLTDKDKIVRTTNGVGVTITVPPNSTVAFPLGSIVGLEQYGAGTLTVAAGAGVTIRSFGGSLALAGQYVAGALRKIATNEWMLTGALA